jgi:phosphate transport system substrate-binding protein
MRFVPTIGILSLLALACATAFAAEIKGAGSSAAQPLYDSLAETYAKTRNVTLTYQPSGSTDGFKQISNKTVDFGATDIALSAEQRAKTRMVCFPTAISGVVPVVNLPGVRKNQLQLTGEVLADIFSRKIVKWNDQRLRALNPALTLPDLAIAVITRSDGSGSTFNFSDYLGKSSAAWLSTYGRNASIVWAPGTTPAKGSSGVVAALKQTAGAIGYVDYQYVSKENLTSAMLKNRDGKFVAAGPAAFSASLNNSTWLSKGAYEEMLTDRPGAASWPITAGTFILLPQASSNPATTIASIKFFTWGFVHGDAVVGKANFVRLPDIVQGRIFGELSAITDAAGVPLKWSLMEAI